MLMKFVLFLVVMASAFLCTRARNILSAALEEEESNDAALTRVKDRMMDAEVLLEMKKEMLGDIKAAREAELYPQRTSSEATKGEFTNVLHGGFQVTDIVNRKEQHRNDKIKMLHEKNAQGDLRSTKQNAVDCHHFPAG